MAWLERENVLDQLGLGDSSVQNSFGPDGAAAICLHKPTQLLPQLSLADSSWYLHLLYLSSQWTPDSLSYYHDQEVSAHWAPGLLAWNEDALLPAELEDFSFEEAFESLLKLCFDGNLLLLEEVDIHYL